MALEYEDLTATAEGMAAARDAKVAEGWRVHTAFSATHYLLERGAPPVNRQPQSPSAPTGNKA